MPGDTSNGSSDAAGGESRGAKRARLAFNRDDMDLDPVKTPEYARWERWRDHAAATAYGFLDSADAGIMAARYQERLMEDGLSVAGVDRAVEWAGGGLDAPTALIYMALFERSTDLRLDVEAAAWKAVPQPSPPAREQAEETPKDQPREPQESPEQAEIRRLEARIRELQLPKVPPLSEGELAMITAGQLPWLWQQELVQALSTWLKAEDPVGRGNAVVETVWKVVYRDCQPTPTHPDGAAARPAPQGWYAQAQQPAPSQTQAQTQAQTQTQAPARAQAPAPAPPGACFRCGLHGHWARDCASGTQGRAPSVAGSVAGSYRGGSVPWVARACTQRTARAAPMTRLDPPRTHVFGVAATTGPWAGRARRRLPRPPRPFRPGRPQRRPAAEEPGASATDGPAGEGGANDEGGGALDLRYAGSAVDSLWWGNYMGEPLALAVRRWSLGTVERWTAILRDVGRFAAHWARAGRGGGTVPVPRPTRRHGPAAWDATRRHISPSPGGEAGMHTAHGAARALAHGTRCRHHHCRATTHPSMGRAGHPPAHGPEHQDHPRLVLPGPCRHLLRHSPQGW